MKSALLTQLALCACPPLIAAATVTAVPQARHAVHRATAPAHHRRTASSPHRRPDHCAPNNQNEVGSGVDRAFLHELTDFEIGQVRPDMFGQGLETALPAHASASISDVSGRAGSWSPIFAGRPGTGPILTPPGTPTNPGSPGGTDPGGGSVPEPASWAFMLFGFGSIGTTIRSVRRKKAIGLAATAAGGATGLVATLEAGSSAALAPARFIGLGAHALRAAALKKLGVCVCSAVALTAAAATVPPLRHALYAATMPAAARPHVREACASTATSAGPASQHAG